MAYGSSNRGRRKGMVSSILWTMIDLAILLLLIGAAAGFFSSRDDRAPDPAVPGAAVPSSTVPAATQPVQTTTLSVRFIDCGQGDAALVECDGHYMLIDGGNKADSQLIYRMLSDRSVTHLDMVVASHPHGDHVGGLPGALNAADADLILCNTTTFDTTEFADFARYADQKGGGIQVPKLGDTYPLGDATVEILGLNAGDEVNDNSIILRVSYGDTAFLFLGDAELPAIEALMKDPANLHADVVKLGHHGANGTLSEQFLRRVGPEACVISVGKDNPYGHPTEETLALLQGMTLYRTDLQGDILAISDGTSIRWETENDASDSELFTAGVLPVRAPNPNDDVPADYVVNRNSLKFHFPECPSVDIMSPNNKWEVTMSRNELLDQGYVPCQNCNP